MRSKLLIAVAFLVILSSCGQNSSSPLGIRTKLSAMKSYEATVEIYVYGNSTDTHYIAKQYCQYPDKLRLELEEPSFLKGQVILYNSGKCTMYNPSIDMEFSVENVKVEQDYMNVGFLLKAIGDSKEVKAYFHAIDGVEYSVLKAPIPYGNDYRVSAEVYFEKLGGTPAYMNITDSSGRLVAHIKYIRFKYNTDIKKEMFIQVKAVTEK